MTQQSSNTPQLNFAQAAKRVRPRDRIIPSDEQAIILETIDGIPQEDYLIALTNLTDPQNLIYASKLSKNRLCVYFKDKSSADQITKNQSYINVLNQNIKIRPLITPSRRLIISNVRPSVPDSIITNVLNQFGLQPTSALYFLRAGVKTATIAHILSFRRCVYIQNIENQEIPEAATFEYGGLNHTIIITEDSEVCSICKKPGHNPEVCRFKNTVSTQKPPNQISDNNIHNEQQTHNTTEQEITSQANHSLSDFNLFEEVIASQNIKTSTTTSTNNKSICDENSKLTIQGKNAITPKSQQSNNSTIPKIDTEKTKKPNLKQNTTINSTHSNDNSTNTNLPTSKRTAHSISSVDSAESLQESTLNNVDVKIRRHNKSRRTRSISPCTPTEEWLRPAEHLFESFILSYNQFYSLLESLTSSHNPITTIKDYTEETTEIVNKLKELYEFTKNRSAKVRLTKLIKNIQTHQDRASSDEDTLDC